MKITTTNGRVIAEAETIQDIETLLAMREPKQERPSTKKRPYRRQCPQCDKTFDTKQGIGMHKRKAHGILGKLTLKKLQAEEMKAAQPLPVKFDRPTYQFSLNK